MVDEVNPYSRRAALGLGIVTLVSLVAAVWLLMTPGEGGKAGVGADGYSRSAIGHSGLISLLHDLDEPVVQMRMLRELGPCGLLVLAEPLQLEDGDGERLSAWIEGAGCTLVVLPKRRGKADPERPHWLGRAEAIPLTEVEGILAGITDLVDAPRPQIARVDGAKAWRSAQGFPLPTIEGPVQLLQTGEAAVEPLISCDEGVLLGEVGDLLVLSDPDVLNNHGLGRGRNAALVVEVLRYLRDGGTVVFDETMHGKRITPSVWHAMGKFPLVLVPVHLLVLLALVAWMANGRFGPALAAARAIGAGKAFLIDNTASLLRRGGHHGHAVRRYRRLRVRQAAESLHAPTGSTYEQNRALLLSRVRDPERRSELASLLRESDSQLAANQAVALAREIRNATAEVLHAGR